MLDTTTKKRIDDCRDILVGKLPDPKAQIEQITIGLIYKFMDDMDKEAIDLGGKAKFFSGEYEKYSWDSLFDTKVTASQMLAIYSEAIASMDKNPNIPQLFRDIFKNAFLPYRDPETLKLFLKTIGEFEYTHSEKLGDAFEYLLSVMGSQGDAGQFRTPRHIIDFLVAIVDPSKTDTILDPACGTAGFLISAFKHIKEKNSNKLTPDERKRLIKNVVGYDISPDMVRLSLVNLYLHGFSDPHIWEYDTLSSEDRWNETYDVILANPPFMSPKGGIRPHKKFSISSNRSEVLFVDYISEHLNPKGRAGIIVPEGIIFQNGTAYKELRKMLVEKYLYAVVSLPAGVFNPYSGVKTSILLMDKEYAKKSDEILFVKIENDGYALGAQRNAVRGGQLEDAIEVLKQFKSGSFTKSPLAHSVFKTEIAKNEDYNLSGGRYIVNTSFNSEFEKVKLEDVLDYEQPTNYIVESEEYNNSFKTPVLTAGKTFILGYTNEVNGVFNNPLPVIIFDDFTTATQYVDFPFKVKSSAMKILKAKEEKASITFLFYLMQHIKFDSSDHKRYWISQYSQIQIPLPPLSVQKEIEAEIKSYQKIIDGAKMVVENYKPRIEIDPEWEIVDFENAPFEIIDGDRGSNYPNGDDFSSEGYCLFLNTKNVRDNGFLFDELMFISKTKDELLRKGKLQREDVLLTTRGTIGNTAYYDNSIPYENIRINSGMLIFRPNNKILLSEYLYYFFQTENCQAQFRNIISGAAQPQLPIRDLKSAKIPVPTIEIQRRVVELIKKEQELVNANNQLIEIFEQKIKDRIARVWGEEKPS